MSDAPLLVSFAATPTWYQVALYRELSRLLAGRFMALLTHGGHADGVRDEIWGGLAQNQTGLLEGYPHHVFHRRPGSPRTELVRLRPEGLAKKIVELAPRAVLLNDHGRSAPYREAMRGARRVGARLLLRSTPYDLAGSSLPRDVLRYAYLRYYYSRFDGFCAVGTLPQLHFESFSGRPECVYSSPYCVDDFYLDELAQPESREALRLDFRAEHGIGRDERVFVGIGRLVPVKRFDWLIRAFLQSRRVRPARFVLLGDGPERSRIEGLAHEAPEGSVLCLGAGGRHHVARVLAGSDIFALASSFEPWGVVVNEALLFGLPCVVSDRVASSYDLIQAGTTGYRFRWKDEADCVRALLGAQEMVDRGLDAQAFARICEMGTSEAAARGVLRAAGLEPVGSGTGTEVS